LHYYHLRKLDLKMMGECILKLLSKKGVAVIEVQYLLRTLKDLTFDNIYHEDYNDWSLTSLKYFFEKIGGTIFNAEEIDTHGGSLRIYISKNSTKKINRNVKILLKKEINFGIKKLSTYKKFGKKIIEIKKNVKKNISHLKKNSKYLIGYGAPAKATTALNFFNISNEIDFIIEDNKLKHNKIIPGVNIPIYPKKKCSDPNATIIVLAWNFFEEIKKNNKNLAKSFINIKSLEKN